MIEGVFIGGLVGLVTGIVSLACLKLINQTNLANHKTFAKLAAQLLAIPTFWFGSPWTATEFLRLMPKELFVLPYSISLAVTFFAIMAYPLFKWIRHLGEQLGGD